MAGKGFSREEETIVRWPLGMLAVDPLKDKAAGGGGGGGLLSAVMGGGGGGPCPFYSWSEFKPAPIAAGSKGGTGKSKGMLFPEYVGW